MVAKRNEGLLVRTEPLQWAKEISKRMVDVVRLEDDALLLDADPELTGAIKRVLVSKGLKIKEIRKQTKAAARLIA
jgi:hypothetical protein